MNLLGISVVLVLLVGVWAQINVLRPECDSPEAEELALVAQDYINNQHTQGYKYALNRIEDIKVYTTPTGDSTYVLEIELLETDCHVLDPTPLANCTVRPKVLTAVEGDCDVVIKKVGGALTVTAFKCKTEESTEDLCLGCPTLLPLNQTDALDFVHASLVTVNTNTVNLTYVLHEIGRMSTQVVSGGPVLLAEYVIVEANCTDDPCVPLQDAMAAHGICYAKGLTADHTVDCRMFAVQVPSGNVTVDPAVPPVVHGHTGSMLLKHGLRFHQLTTFHNPELSIYLSAESSESAEVVLAASAGVNQSVAGGHAPDAAPLPDAPAHLPDAAPLPDAPAHLPDAAPLPDAPAHLPDAAGSLPDAAANLTDDAHLTDAAPLQDTAHLPDAAPVAADDSSSAADSPSSKEIPMNFIFKRDVAAVTADAFQTDPIVLTPVCPGRIRYF